MQVVLDSDMSCCAYFSGCTQVVTKDLLYLSRYAFSNAWLSSILAFISWLKIANFFVPLFLISLECENATAQLFFFFAVENL